MDELKPSHEDVRAALAAICESQVFANKKLLPDLLTCIVNHWLAGESIKEEVLLVEVFNRDPSRESPTIVRTNALNLRAALAEYYDVEGRRDEVRIAIPRGGYNADISYSAIVREQAELDRREAGLKAREREIERRQAEFDRKVEEYEALYAKRETLNAARHAEVDEKLAALEGKLMNQIQKKAVEAEEEARKREARIIKEVNSTISAYSDDGGF